MPPLGDWFTPEQRAKVQAEALRQAKQEALYDPETGIAIRFINKRFEVSYMNAEMMRANLTPLDRDFLKSIRVKAD